MDRRECLYAPAGVASRALEGLSDSFKIACLRTSFFSNQNRIMGGILHFGAISHSPTSWDLGKLLPDSGRHLGAIYVLVINRGFVSN
jgi:hypothetical protein